MNFRLPALICTIVLGLAFTAMAAAPDTKLIDATKLIGVWLVDKSESVPAGSTLEFTKDKVKLTAKFGDKAFTIDGTYKLKEKDALEVTFNYGGKTKEDKATITMLTATELHLKDDKNATAKYKRVK